MSQFYDQASLVMVPSGYKTGKVYSQKPLSTDGELTFTRASSATRVGPDGLIEKVRTNLILQSETFDNASWTKYAGATITANTTTAPDGTLTADTLNVATNAYSGVHQAISSSLNVYTVSLFVKKGTKDFIYLFDIAAAAQGWFNLTNGTLGSMPVGYNASITSVGDGWYRISFGNKNAVTPAYFQLGLSDADASFTPASTGTAFIWGAQAELSDFGATPYIGPTTTAAVSVGPVSGLPRLDYLGSSCPRLLLEPQRTNLNPYSEQFDNAAWVKVGTTITANNTTSPDGYTNADKIIPSTTGTNFAYQNFAGSGTQTNSFFVKAGGKNFCWLLNAAGNTSSYFNLANGTVAVNASGTAKIESFGNGWYRISETTTSVSGNHLGIGPSDVAGNANSTVNGTDGIFVFGGQNEAASYVTSYIPTLGAAVTRGKDDCDKFSVSALIGQTEGTVFLEWVQNSLETSEDLYSNDKNLTGSISLQVSTNGSLSAYACYAGTYIVVSTSIGAIQAGQTYKVAFAYKSGSTALYLNGALIGTSSDAFAFTTTLSQIDIANNTVYFAGGANKKVTQLLQFKTRLTNAQLAELTTL